MKRLPIDQLGSIKPGESTVEVRFVNTSGETEVWLVETGLMGLPTPMRTSVKVAYIDNGVDTRIGNQIEIINRLLAHLKHHHVGINCDYPLGAPKESHE